MNYSVVMVFIGHWQKSIFLLAVPKSHFDIFAIQRFIAIQNETNALTESFTFMFNI